MKNLLALFALILVLIMASCSNNRYEEVNGYVLASAKLEVKFSDGYAPLCYILAITEGDTIKAEIDPFMGLPGRQYVYWHDKLPAEKQDKVYLRMDRDRSLNTYHITYIELDMDRYKKGK